jgi:hypothetical protein
MILTRRPPNDISPGGEKDLLQARDIGFRFFHSFSIAKGLASTFSVDP